VKQFIALICCFFSVGMSSHTVVTFQPDSACGQDAFLTSLAPDANYGTHRDFLACAWTNQSVPTNVRSLVSFDLATIPPGATIVSATLELFHWNSPQNTGHSNLSAPATCWLERVVTPWSENTVTWNTQPATTPVNAINVPAPVSMTQNYSFNVISLVMDMLNDPANSYGFMLRQQTESYYRSVLFASSDMSNSALHPKLTITYDLDIPPLPGCYTNFVITQSPPATPGDPVVHFPNVFTPNGDGINDSFYADSSNVELVEFAVYDRWGMLIYTSATQMPWNGKHNGNECSDGTYYYVFRYKWNGAPDAVAGFFTLIR
jgi:gliding motility-associated-like protein